MVFEYFTPVTGFIGGALIGLSAATMLLVSGEILGASGIVSAFVLNPQKAITDPTMTWKLVFFALFMLVSNLFLGPHFTDDERLGNDESIPITSIYGYIIGGLLVGFGTRLGNGCTSGHGICGMARLSKRSIVAVCTFMTSGLGVATMTSPDNKSLENVTSFLRTDESPDLFNRWLGLGICMIVSFPATYALVRVLLLLLKQQRDTVSKQGKNQKVTEPAEESGRTFVGESTWNLEEEKSENQQETKDKTDDVEEQNIEAVFAEKDTEQQAVEDNTSATDGQSTNDDGEKTDIISDEQMTGIRKIGPAAVASTLFATGLAVSGMVLPSKILGFLNLYLFARGSYDPTLVTVMVGGLIVSFVSYQFVKGWTLFPNNPFVRECPLASEKFCIPTNKVIDWKLLLGASVFGIGWAIGSLCPGPALFLAATGTKPVIFGWWPAFIVGSFIAQKLKERL